MVSDLKCLSENFNYRTTLETMLRDRIVCGINDVSTQKTLSESELTFKKALISQGIKAAHRYVSDLGDQNLASDEKVDMRYTNRSVGKDQKKKNGRQPWNITCYHCEENHKTEECPHKKKNALAVWIQDIWLVTAAVNNRFKVTVHHQMKGDMHSRMQTLDINRYTTWP